MLDRSQYNELLDEFEREYKRDYDDAVSWYGVGGNEIVARLRDGSRTIYNGITKGVRTIRPTSRDCRIDDATWKKRFGQKLKVVMFEKGITARHLSELTGIPYQTLCTYTSGQRAIPGPNISKIARALDCSVSELMYFD